MKKKRGQDESAGRVEQVEKIVRDDLWQKDNSMSERKGLQDGSESCYDIWFWETGTNKKTHDKAGRGQQGQD